MRIGVERIGTSFVGYGLFDGIIHEIYRTEDEKSAYQAYQDVIKEDFSIQGYLEEWQLPSELSRIKLSANNQKIGCNIYKSSGAEECNLLAQYGPYLVRFSFRLHGLRFIEIVPILKEIDMKMVDCILQK